MKTLQALALLVCLLCVSRTLAFTSGINAVVSSLADYQSPGGGFQAYRDSEATLESTSQALFLSSLFGLRDKINSGQANAFVQSLANPDHGYGNKLGQPSDVESVRNALLSFTHLGTPISNSAGVATFIHSLYDRETKLFAPTVGGTGTIKSTAVAFQVLAILDQLQSKEVTSKFDAIKSHLNTLKKPSKDGYQFFSSITSDNYYAILVASYVGFDFGDVKPWAQYFLQRQFSQGPYIGGFFSDSELQDPVVEDAAHAVNALYTLQRTAAGSDLVDQIATEALIEYANHLPRDLAIASNAYIAISRTSAFRKLFRIVPSYDVLDSRFRLVGNRIIQGTQVKPAVSVRTSYGLAHAGLDVSATITHAATNEKTTRKLTWNAESQVYATDEVYDSADKLGNVTFEFALRWRVADLGSEDLVLNLKDLKAIGYDLSVSAKATHAGKEVDTGSEIGFGTEFVFDLKLGTVKQPKPTLTSGDFTITFSVRDSSGVAIYESDFNARDNNKPIKFTYTLEVESIPAGDVIFSFAIGNAKGVHTVSGVVYRLPVRMVASHISFKGFTAKQAPEYKIGDTVSVQITPASQPDLRTLKTYSPKDSKGKPIERRFFMDVSSSETGRVLFSLLGKEVVTDGTLSYSFERPVDAAFPAIGTNVVSFHYQSVSGEVFDLLNYDSNTNELFEDNVHLNYTVNAELHVTDIKNGPKDGELVYGNEVKFTFKVKDAITQKYVFAAGDNTVALVLRHETQGRAPFTSNVQPAVQIFDKTKNPDHFEITWSVNPNAVKGRGFIQLVAQGSDGKEIQLLEEKTKQVYKVGVTIGGQISVQSRTYSNRIDEEETVFFVDAQLSSAEKVLNGADLRATVTRDSKPVHIDSLPVSFAGGDGLYQVSWSMKNDEAVTGQYVVDFYREVDRQHVLSTPGASGDSVQPLFTVTLGHTQQRTNILPFKTEFLVLALLAVTYFWTSFKKMDIEGLLKANKKKTK